jgi:hypothetical protein
MRRFAARLLIALVCLPALAADTAPPIDWDHARQLFQRSQRGETLSPDEQTYLDRAKAARQSAQTRPAGNLPGKESTNLPPLTLPGNQKYQGFSLGLYGDGVNSPPAIHLKRAIDLAVDHGIKPLNASGQPAADGRVGFMSVGMSNTTQEFSLFVQIANSDPAKNPRLTIVDAAQGGKAADSWTSKDRPETWREADRRLQAANLTPQQVQILWIKQARINPATLGEFPKHAQALQADLKNIVLLAKERYPNLKVVYLSSRTYGGWSHTALNPEPYAYESAFSVQWLIEDQIKELDKDLAYGRAPLLLWGPYLWTDGVKGRPGDQLIWSQTDTGPDGTPQPKAGLPRDRGVLSQPNGAVYLSPKAMPLASCSPDAAEPCEGRLGSIRSAGTAMPFCGGGCPTTCVPSRYL